MKRRVRASKSRRHPDLDSDNRALIRGLFEGISYNRVKQSDRSALRAWLYRNDPIWRLTKLKDNRERRLRAKHKQGKYP